MKQSRPSSLAPFVKVKQPQWDNDAERITGIQPDAGPVGGIIKHYSFSG